MVIRFPRSTCIFSTSCLFSISCTVRPPESKKCESRFWPHLKFSRSKFHAFRIYLQQRIQWRYFRSPSSNSFQDMNCACIVWTGPINQTSQLRFRASRLFFSLTFFPYLSARPENFAKDFADFSIVKFSIAILIIISIADRWLLRQVETSS